MYPHSGTRRRSSGGNFVPVALVARRLHTGLEVRSRPGQPVTWQKKTNRCHRKQSVSVMLQSVKSMQFCQICLILARSYAMERILDNCSQHLWGMKDLSSRCRYILQKFREVHPCALEWKLGLIGPEFCTSLMPCKDNFLT